MPIIEVSNLSKSYEYYRKQPGILNSIKSLFKREKLYTQAVDNISFSIEEGELVGFLGPNGAGKTTTLKILSGILYPSKGVIKVLGYTPWGRKQAYQKQFSIVMGFKNQLWWDLPAMESFILNKEIYEVPDKKFHQTLDELVELLDIKDILNIQVRKLSLGRRMKAELVSALIHSPKVLFLDEPTIGLDVLSQQNLREFIRDYNKIKKTTILLTSHYMEDVERLCKRVIIIDHGRIIYDGRIDNLIDKYVDHKVIKITFLDPVNKNDFSKFGTVKEFSKQRVVLAVPNQKVKEAAAAILTKMPVDDILIDEEELDEIIRKVFNHT